MVRKHRHALADQAADDVPHGASAARIQARGRLVEEDDARVADEGHREVEPPCHAAGVGARQLAARLDEVEFVEQFGCASLAFAPVQMMQIAHEQRFSSPVINSSTAENWPVTPSTARTACGLTHHVVTGHVHLTAIGGDEGRQDLHGGGLARAVRAEQRKDTCPLAIFRSMPSSTVLSPYDFRSPRTAIAVWLVVTCIPSVPSLLVKPNGGR